MLALSLLIQSTMHLKDINIQDVVEQTRKQLIADKTITPSLKMSIELILMIVTLLAQKFGLNSKNSSIPPSQDSNRKKSSTTGSELKPGGQPGRIGKTLLQTDSPDEINIIYVERDALPKGQYHEVGFQKRQVVDIDISKVVTEYQAQILENEQGIRFIGEFPHGVTRPVQYGAGLKAHAVYLSQYQLLPYNRIEEYFNDQLGIPLSAGSLFNFNQHAAKLVSSSGAQGAIQRALAQSPLLHVDETGINVDGVRHWLHSASTLQWTYFYPHKNRGKVAMDEAGVLPYFTGVLCHDHWKPYYQYTQCEHALCNAHHLRELERAWEQDGMEWAKSLQTLLKTINKQIIDQGALDEVSQQQYIKEYQGILARGDIHCPPPDENTRKKGQRGRLKRTKSRALLERLRDYRDDVLRFMVSDVAVPFTNNQGENDIRMTKVHQKISGCFRSLEGAEMFCLIRSYLSTCRKQSVSASMALTLLFNGQLPNIFHIESEAE